jgi:hypothetical protein
MYSVGQKIIWSIDLAEEVMKSEKPCVPTSFQLLRAVPRDESRQGLLRTDLVNGRFNIH